MSIVAIVERTIMSPKTQPINAVGKLSVDIMPKSASAPAPKMPEATLAINTPKNNHVTHDLRSSNIVSRAKIAIPTAKVAMKTSVQTKIIAAAETATSTNKSVMSV